MMLATPWLALTAAPISSLKYGKCQSAGSSTTPSSAMNRLAVILDIKAPSVTGHHLTARTSQAHRRPERSRRQGDEITDDLATRISNRHTAQRAACDPPCRTCCGLP